MKYLQIDFLGTKIRDPNRSGVCLILSVSDSKFTVAHGKYGLTELSLSELEKYDFWDEGMNMWRPCLVLTSNYASDGV